MTHWGTLSQQRNHINSGEQPLKVCTSRESWVRLEQCLYHDSEGGSGEDAENKKTGVSPHLMKHFVLPPIGKSHAGSSSASGSETNESDTNIQNMEQRQPIATDLKYVNVISPHVAPHLSICVLLVTQWHERKPTPTVHNHYPHN